MRYGMVYFGAVPSERCEEGMLESHPEVARIVGLDPGQQTRTEYADFGDAGWHREP